MSRSIKLLQDQRDAFMLAAQSTNPAREALWPYMHWLRDIADPRPRAVKIREALDTAIQTVPRGTEAKMVSNTRLRLEQWIDRFPLADIPSDTTIRRRVRHHLAPQLTHGSADSCFSTTSQST